MAIESLASKGYYYSDLVSGKLINAINKIDDDGTDVNTVNNLGEREIEFLKLICTELTYKEVADKLFVSPRTVDGYREQLFAKLNIKTRVGLVMYAIKNGIVNL